MTIDIYKGTRQPDFATPQGFVDYIEEVFDFNFDLDAAASKENAKARLYIDKEMDSFKTDWDGHVWLNPPYGNMIEPFIKRAIQQRENCESIWVLVPARTDTKWFHDLVIPNANEVYLIRGRLNFIHDSSVKDSNAPYASILIRIMPWKTIPKVKSHKNPAKILTLNAPLEARR